jgi:hypothetical protein
VSPVQFRLLPPLISVGDFWCEKLRKTFFYLQKMGGRNLRFVQLKKLSFYPTSTKLSGVICLVMRRNFFIALIFSMTVFPFVKTEAETSDIFNSENFPGAWTLTTNSDATIIATETAVHRQGREVYSRVLQLDAVEQEAARSDSNPATDSEVRSFIQSYRPPPIPYTSEATANRTGREKFNCLEFAEDIVKKATAANIPAQVIGIKFKGKIVGHAVAGFPTAEGGMLYFDSTPGAGQISHAAHEAHVQVGKPYERDGGGELAVVGQLPVSKIISVSKFLKFAEDLTDIQKPISEKTILIVTNENHAQAKGIDYAAPDTLQISDEQLALWNEAASNFLAAQIYRQDQEKIARQRVVAQADAQALAENERLAANGDVYGQLRMGERYWTGDGVGKNPVKAQVYLQLAADQGSPTAIQELKVLAQKNDGIENLVVAARH